jgi:hypothetical protein
MMSVTYKPFMLSVIMLNVITLSVVMLIVIMLSVMVPLRTSFTLMCDLKQTYQELMFAQVVTKLSYITVERFPFLKCSQDITAIRVI